MNTLKLFVGAYLAVAVLTLVVIFLLRGDTAAVNDAVWVRGTVVVVSAALMFLFTLRRREGRAGRRDPAGGGR